MLNKSIGQFLALLLSLPCSAMNNDNNAQHPPSPRDNIQMQLMQAVESNDLIEVKTLLSSGADPNWHDPGNLQQTALHLANSPEMVRLLVLYQAQVNIQDDDGMTPAHLAALRFENEVLEELLDQGANPEIVDKNGHAAFCYTSNFCPAHIRNRLQCDQMCEDDNENTFSHCKQDFSRSFSLF